MKPVQNLVNFVAEKTYKYTFFKLFFLINMMACFMFAGMNLIVKEYIAYIFFTFIGIIFLLIYSIIQMLRGAEGATFV